MTVILIILTGLIFGALFTYAFYLGMRYQAEIDKEKKNEDALTITERNREGIKELYEWLNYGGRRE